MRRRRTVLAAVTAGLAAGWAGPAHAGTYDVVSCGAPGAGGVNRAWTGRADDPASLEVASCGGALFGGSSAQPNRTAPFFTSASWTFTAPQGTTITRLVAWRWGRYFGNGWRVSARQGDANIIGGPFGETCNIAPGQLGCEFGSRTGVGPASRVQYELNTNQVFYNAACEAGGGCPTSNNAGTRFAEFEVYGTAVTLRDDTAPRLSAGGPLLAEGWRRPGESQQVTFSASDSTGIRRVALGGAATEASDRPCDYTRPVPCSAASGSLTPQLGEGVHQLTITAEDAARNPTTLSRTVRIDGTPPAARIAVARGRNILVDVTDDVAGVASGRIEVRGSTREPFRTLPTTLADGRLRARMDRGRAHRSDIRVVAEDAAGNRREGLGTKLRITSARAGRRLRVGGGRVTVPHGRAVRLNGRLSLIRGASVPGADVIATAAVARSGAPQRPLARVRTGRTGRFSLRLPAGPSRVLRLSSPGSGAALGATGRLSIRVPAASTMRASRTVLSGAGRVTFSGRVRSLGQGFPVRGALVAVQGYSGGRWRTFEDTRTDRRGRWSAAYRFRGVPGTYPIRLRIRRQARFPFVLGYSPTVRVRVR